MAIDTADKRASAINVMIPWRGILPVPDGSLNLGDRQQVALTYRGIVASGGTGDTPELHARYFFADVGALMSR